VREIRQLCFGSGSRHSLRPATNAATVDVCQCFSPIISQQQGILQSVVGTHTSLRLHCEALLLPVRNLYSCVHKCQKLPICLVSHIPYFVIGKKIKKIKK